ncbi:MAG: AI-2E family transporter [Clostridiales bacterium]|nr:AI-2E family transporter [Clostridiales bacterium]
MMNSNNKKNYIYWMFAIFGAIALNVALFFLIFRFKEFGGVIGKIMAILKPMIYGAAIAYLLKPVCNTYENKLNEHLPSKLKKMSKALAITGSMLTMCIIVYLLLIIIIPQVVNSVTSLINTLPDKLNYAASWLEETLKEDTVVANYITENYIMLKDTAIEWISNELIPNMQNIQNILAGVGIQIWNSVMFLKNLLIGLIIAVYLLASRKKFAVQGKMVLYSIVKTKWADKILTELKYADNTFVGFINGKILDSAIIGVICYVCCLIFKFPNAMLVSVIVGVTNIIPFFGPFIGAIPSALLIFIESPLKSLWFLIFIVVLQQVDGNIIGPKILGNSTGLSSFWVLFSILVFGGLWGFVGMVIGVPLFAVIYDIAKKLVFCGLKRNGKEDMIPLRSEEETTE